MASGTIPKGMRVAEYNINNSIDSNGNALVKAGTLYAIIAKLDDAGGSHLIGTPFIFTNGYTYIHVTTTAGAIVPSGTTVTGKLWYLEQ